ncbi:MAG TPA: acetolactate synthase large subunit [Candidatus Sulfotelmatobacter sp.]|nr:acetolactate synthase large subunit [Candidatus Sulfotelmatobacter sp.]
MNGADILIETLVAGGVRVCFTNPGTSEMHIVAALNRRSELRAVLTLFEGVATGAADGYARMAGKPACTLLHLGPGLANGLANLHNARRANVPIVNVVGQHATYHLPHDTPLTSDIEGIALPYSRWVRTSMSAREIGRDTVDAIVASLIPPGQIATLIVPADVAWEQGVEPIGECTVPSPPLPAAATIRAVAEKLRDTQNSALLLSGSALYGSGLTSAGRIAAATGAGLLSPYPFTRLQRGSGAPPVVRMPYILERAREFLKNIRLLILVGAAPPMAYFASPGRTSTFTAAECEIYTLSNAAEDCAGALNALASELGVHHLQPLVSSSQDTPVPSGAITLDGIAAAIAALLPENAIVVDESMTSGNAILPAVQHSAPHDYLANTGGSIGIAMPLALGAAIACSDRRVLCLSADGSGMYTLQALWSMAREGLNVTNVIFANRVYGVLKREYLNLGIGEPDPPARDLLEIGRPDLDWVSLARGMGVPAQRISSLDELVKALMQGFAADGPTLIEIPL